jgi:hypothetical protein
MKYESLIILVYFLLQTENQILKNDFIIYYLLFIYFPPYPTSDYCKLPESLHFWNFQIKKVLNFFFWKKISNKKKG